MIAKSASPYKRPARVLLTRLAAAGMLAGAAGGAAHAGSERVIYRFPKSNDGGTPQLNGALTITTTGILFGVAGPSHDGKNTLGDVFVLKPPVDTTGWRHKLLYGFKGSSAAVPDGSGSDDGVTRNGKGVLFGVTRYTGAIPTGCGIIYSLTPPGAGRTAWTETILHTFQATDPNDGCNPVNENLLIGADGSLYGTTTAGGSVRGGGNGLGTIFQLHPPKNKSSEWIETVLYSFSGGNDGSAPQGSVVQGPTGVLYGTAYSGGAFGGNVNGFGTVWSFIPPSLAPPNGQLVTLHSFAGGSDGANPTAGLIGPLNLVVRGQPDEELYGTTSAGGGVSTCTATDPSAVGCGVFFVLHRQFANQDYTETILHTFSGFGDGATPIAPLQYSARNFWGTTTGGGGSATCSGGCGTIFNVKIGLSLDAVYSIDYAFRDNNDGAFPRTGLAQDAAGNLYGMTDGGDVSGDFGTVFQFTP